MVTVEPTEQMYIQDLKVYDEDPIPNDDEVPLHFSCWRCLGGR